MMISPGKILYQAYYRPRAWLHLVKNCGGLKEYLKIEQGKKAMARAAGHLLPSQIQENAIEIYCLTGKKFWALSAFCMYSLIKSSEGLIKPIFIDDGTLTPKLIQDINRQFPGSKIKTAGMIEAQLDKVLPVAKYPLINHKRAVYPHIKKLTDIHAGSTGWKMVFDSDMLFFRRPAAVINWLSNPKQPFFLYDPISSYHYSTGLMANLTQHTVIENLNVGMVGLKSEEINWDDIENWIGELEKEEGSSYLLEQALSAMIAAGRDITIADKTEYQVMPSKAEIHSINAVMHHYVARSKDDYYKTAWRKIISP